MIVVAAAGYGSWINVDVGRSGGVGPGGRAGSGEQEREAGHDRAGSGVALTGFAPGSSGLT